VTLFAPSNFKKRIQTGLVEIELLARERHARLPIKISGQRKQFQQNGQCEVREI
jgi:hypothetical protein